MAPRAVTDPRWAYAGMGLCTLGIFVRLIGGGTEHVLLPDGGTVADAMRVLSPLVPWHAGVRMVYEGKVLEPQQGLGELGITAGATLFLMGGLAGGGRSRSCTRARAADAKPVRDRTHSDREQRRMPITGLFQAAEGTSFEERVSRTMISLLRHRAYLSGLRTDGNGWARIDQLLDLEWVKEARIQANTLDRLTCTKINGKPLFQLTRGHGGVGWIRATEGHTMPHIRTTDALRLATGGANAPTTDFLDYLAPLRQWQAILAHGIRRGREGRDNHPVPVRLLARPSDWRGPRRGTNPILLVQVDSFKIQVTDAGAGKAGAGILYANQDIPQSTWRQVLLQANGRTVRVWPPERSQKEDLATP